MSTHTHTPLRRDSASRGRSWAASKVLGATAWRVTLSCSVAVPILTRIAIYLTRIAIYLTRIAIYLTRMIDYLTRIAIRPLPNRDPRVLTSSADDCFTSPIATTTQPKD